MANSLLTGFSEFSIKQALHIKPAGKFLPCAENVIRDTFLRGFQLKNIMNKVFYFREESDSLWNNDELFMLRLRS